MDLDQLKLIGHLDQLKKHNILTQEEYDTARGRVFAINNTPGVISSSTSSAVLGKSKSGLGILVSLVLLIGGAFLIRSYLDRPREHIADTNEQRDSEEFEKNKYKYSTSETPFDPDILQNGEMLTIKNRNTLDYKNCELTINDRFKAKVPLIDKDDSYFLTYNKLADEDGNIYNPKTMMIVEFEFYCKDYNGHTDIVSFEKK